MTNNKSHKQSNRKAESWKQYLNFLANTNNKRDKKSRLFNDEILI